MGGATTGKVCYQQSYSVLFMHKYRVGLGISGGWNVLAGSGANKSFCRKVPSPRWARLGLDTGQSRLYG